MAAIIKDRVQETTATTGTGALALGGAVFGFRTFGSVMSTGDTGRYGWRDPVTGDWETGNGTYNSTSNTLARTTVEDSSNGGAAVSMAGSAGTVVWLNLSAAEIAALGVRPAAVTYGATTTANCDATQFATVAATGDFTLAISGTPTEGQALTVAVLGSGATVNVTLPGTVFTIPTSSAATSPVSVPSSSETLFAFRYSARTSKWRVVSLVGGYS